jgi:hypothetical protein
MVLPMADTSLQYKDWRVDRPVYLTLQYLTVYEEFDWMVYLQFPIGHFLLYFGSHRANELEVVMVDVEE